MSGQAFQAQPRSASPAAQPREPAWIAIGIAATFFVLTLIQVSNHVMWRDEIRTWQVCAPASGLVQLWHDMRYEGVPVLWYWIVFALTRLTNNPFAMQFVHALIATATIYLVARFAPFSLAARVLFALGYFPFFEYAAITRNYALVFLFLVIACVLISRPRLNIWALAGVMFVLTQVSIWGAGFAGLMMLAGAGKIVWQGERFSRVILPVALVLLGVALCVIEVRPGPGPTFVGSWRDAPPVRRVLGSFAAVYRGWFPIPAWSEHFWNTNILDGWLRIDPSDNAAQEHAETTWLGVQAVLGVAALAGALLLVSRRPLALGVLLAGCAALIGFEYLFRGAARHHGHLFMLLIAASWLAQTTPAWTTDAPTAARSTLSARLDRLRQPALLALLIVNAIAGIGAATAGMILPFSATRATADYIRKTYDPGINLFGVLDYCTSPIAQWLGRPIYFPQMHRAATYNTQDDAQRIQNITEDELMPQLVGLIDSSGRDAVVIFSSDQMLAPRDFDSRIQFNGKALILRVRRVAAFPRSVEASEKMILFHVSLLPVPTVPAGSRP
jgi:hypothetical protein